MAKKLVLDAGHGGKDSGAVGNGLKEKDLTLRIVKGIRDELTKYEGVEVYLTREGDTYPTLTDRANFANKLKADYFCSVHINAGGGTGYETFRQEGVSSTKTVEYQKTLTNEIMNQVEKFGVKPHGTLLKDHNLAVLRQTDMPAVLTESLFIDTASDAKLLKDDNFIKAVIQGHVNGFVKVLGLTKKATAVKPVDKAPAQDNSRVNYRVIAGSYGDKKNAQEQCDKLSKKGFANFIAVYHDTKGIFYRVVAGSYADKANADEQIAKLKKAGFEAFADAFYK